MPDQSLLETTSLNATATAQLTLKAVQLSYKTQIPALSVTVVATPSSILISLIKFPTSADTSTPIVSNAQTSERSLTKNRQQLLDSVKFKKAVACVSRGILVECQQNTVNVRKFVKNLVQREYHPSEFFPSKKSEVLKTQNTEVAAEI